MLGPVQESVATETGESPQRAEQNLLFPSLIIFYSTWHDIAEALVRVFIGLILLMHGWAKMHIGFAGISDYMARQGLVPSSAWAGAAMFLETVGASCLIIGLFTRFFAAGLAIEMAIALVVVHVMKGFSVGQGGFEYVLLLGIVLFAIAVHGGGHYSFDRLIGKEL
jgi:putative oxidoreductase